MGCRTNGSRCGDAIPVLDDFPGCSRTLQPLQAGPRLVGQILGNLQRDADEGAEWSEQAAVQGPGYGGGDALP